MPVDETRHLSRVPPLEVDKVTVILVQGYPAFTLAEEKEDERRRCKAEVEWATVWNDNLKIDENHWGFMITMTITIAETAKDSRISVNIDEYV